MQIEPFLLDFGTPYIKIFPEAGRKKEAINVHRGNHRPLEECIEINRKEPVGVFFTPNGNRGKKVDEDTESVSGLLTGDPIAPKYNALHLDIDISHTVYENFDDLKKNTIETFMELGLEPTYGISKLGGPHLFWIIHPDDRDEINKVLSEKEYMAIMMYLADCFVGGDKAEGMKKLNGVMRLPNTRHWKKSNEIKINSNPIYTQLFQRYDGDFHIEYNEEKKKYIYLKDILHLVEISKDYKQMDQDHEKFKKWTNKFIESSLSEVTFEILFDKLKKYPRSVSSSMIDDETKDIPGIKSKQYYFSVGNNNKININIIDGPVIETNGYSIKRGDTVKKDFINSFTIDKKGGSKYSLFDRPRGPITSFIMNYFGKNKSKIFSFLEKEIGINISDIDIDTLEEGAKLFVHGDSKMVIDNQGIELETVKRTNNGGVAVVQKKLFDIKLMPLGYSETHLNEDNKESKEINKVYLFYDTSNKRNIILRRYNTKSNFNRYLSSIGLFFYGSDDDIGTFFSILDRNNLPKLEMISYNGVYENFVILGGKIIYTAKEYDEKKYYFNTLFDFPIIQNTKQITTKGFIEKMKTCFDEKFIYIPILQFSAMMLMNSRKNMNVYPSLLFTGETGKGKSTIVNILKNYGLYSGKEREFSVGGNATSAQLVKQAATDNSILFLEEITGMINPATEQSVRAIINRDKGGVGITGGKNIYYNFASPVLGLGQRTFIEDSINNRFSILDMDHQNKRGDSQQLQELYRYSCTDYVYKRLYENGDLIKSLYEKYSQKLIDSDLLERARDVSIYIFIMNELLEVNMPFNTLLEQVKRHLKNVGLDKPKHIVSREGIFKSLMIEGFMKKQITGTYSSYENDTSSVYEIYVSSEFLERNRAKMFSSINFFNEKSKEFDTNERMSIIGNMLTIKIYEEGHAKRCVVDKVLDGILTWLSKTYRGVFAHVPSF